MGNTQTTSNSLDHSDGLFTLFRDQAEVLQRMKRLVQRQRQAVVQDDPEALLSLLKQRQAVMEVLSEMGGQIKRVRAHWESQRASLSPHDRAQASRHFDEIAKSFEDILAADAQDVRMLAAKKQLIGNTLRTTHTMAHAVSAYASRVPPPRTATRLDEAS